MRMLYLSATAVGGAGRRRAHPHPRRDHRLRQVRPPRRRATPPATSPSRGLPDGAWYVITVAAPVGGGERMAVMRRVETNGDTVKVVLR